MSLEDIIKNKIEKLKKDVQDTLENEVAELVKDKIIEHIDSDVYKVYTPNIYERTYELKDKNNMKVEKYEEVGVEILNTTVHDGKDITQVVESGIGYDFNESNGFPNPPYTYQNERPFMKNTKEELERSKEHIKVLKNNLIKKGYKID